MSRSTQNAELFGRLHIKGRPVILFNIWDAGSAQAVAEAGAKAIATGSWSVAAANGFGDGQNVPLEFVLANVRRISAAVDLPVTLDFEGGYSADIDGLKENTAALIAAGAVGINFEDQIIDGEGLYTPSEQAARIAAIRSAADEAGVALFINARTDVFLKSDPATHGDHLEEALGRGGAYAEAGASGFFAPGLKDPDLIAQICKRSELPVNIMVMADTPSNQEMADLGVARISYGPRPYRQMMDALKTAAREAFAAGSLE